MHPRNEIIPAQVSIVRFDSLLYALAETPEYLAAVDMLRTQHPKFFSLFTAIMGWQDTALPHIAKNINLYFLTDPYMLELYDSCKRVFTPGRLAWLKKELGVLFARMDSLLPAFELPVVFLYVAPFAYKVVLDTGIVGIELDMYLGKNFKYYSSLNFPAYMIRKFEPEYIPVDVAQLLLSDLYPPPAHSSTLLSHMIYNGKILYALQHLLPHYPPHMLIGWTEEQYEWVKDNEAHLWSYFLEHDLLYSTDYTEYKKYITDGARTAGLPPQAPGNIGSWLGWQIVKAFATQKTTLTLHQLLALPDTTGQFILSESHYKPPRRLLF